MSLDIIEADGTKMGADVTEAAPRFYSSTPLSPATKPEPYSW